MNLGSNLILASGSPRRKELMALGGWQFRIDAAEVDETPLTGEPPSQYVQRLAQSKAMAVSPEALPNDVIVAADTTVVDVPAGKEAEDGVILGKPVDEAEATQMLLSLRGHEHQVLTGLAVFRMSDRKMLVDLCSTDVKMRDYSDQEIAAYVASGDPLDKAGAYAIQNEEFHPVESIHGCYANVVGLPVCHLARMLEQFGIPPQTQLVSQCLTDPDHPCLIAEQILKGNH